MHKYCLEDYLLDFFVMDYKEFYIENKEKIIKFLVDINYTPHKLVSEAYSEGTDVYEYIYLLYSI